MAYGVAQLHERTFSLSNLTHHNLLTGGGVRSEGSEDNATGRWATALSLRMTSIWPLATNIYNIYYKYINIRIYIYISLVLAFVLFI